MGLFKRIADLLQWGTSTSARETQQRREKPFKAKLKPLPPNTVGSSRQVDQTPEPTRTGAEETDDTFFPLTPTSNQAGDFDTFAAGSPDYNATENTKVDADEAAELKGEYVLDFEAQDAKIAKEVENLRELGWPEEVTDVYYKISMRGYEPLLPSEWEKDFPGYPTGLFTEREAAYIVPLGNSDFRGM